jgi:CubicO group peptidase (beta-lactamase class C family)
MNRFRVAGPCAKVTDSKGWVIVDPYLSEESRSLREDALTARRDIGDRSWGFGLAVDTDGAYGWYGGLSSSFWISPALGLTVIVLTQRTWGSPDLPAVHREIGDAAIRSCS